MTCRVLVLGWLALMLTGCSQKQGADGTQASAGRTSTERSLPAPDTSLKCASFSRHECMSATHCTLVLDKDAAAPANYLCRDAQGPCEKDIAQGNAKACKARAGCTFDQGGCYCHCKGYGSTAVEDKSSAPGCACVCAGGPPPRCRGTDEPPSLQPSAPAAPAASASATPAASASATPAASATTPAPQ